MEHIFTGHYCHSVDTLNPDGTTDWVNSGSFFTWGEAKESFEFKKLNMSNDNKLVFSRYPIYDREILEEYDAAQ